MRLSRRDFGLGLAGAGVAGSVAAQAADQSQALTAYLDAAFEAEVQMDPERLTRLGRKTRYGELRDRSQAGADRTLAWRRQNVAAMKAQFDPARLNEEARDSFDIWSLELERAERAAAWRGHAYVFDRNGPHTGLPNFLINSHRVDAVSDMEAYISRVNASGPALDELLGQAKASAAKGVRMPRFSYEQTLSEIARLNRGAPFGGEGDSALFADGKTKIARLVSGGKLSAADGEAMQARLAAAMTGQMKPAYDRLVVWLSADRAKASAEPKGAGSLPRGGEFYNAMLSLQTTTGMTADQIHELGLSEVKRIRGEMEVLKARIGFTGTLEEFFTFLRTDDRFYVPNTDAGRADYLRRCRDHLSEMQAKLPGYFGRLPKAQLVVRRVEAFREEPGGAAHYSVGARDGSRPGAYYVHLTDTRATPIFEIEGTSYHEGHPGHHMQFSIAQELTGLPVFRTQYSYGAYGEGWGLYVEDLAKEMGFYADPYSDFGRLGRDIWRAIRLVVDTGIHAKGWSEDRAYRFYSANSPQPEGKIRSEIRRYFVMPGQATSYKVGQVRIKAIRDRARQALGSRFDYRSFHDVVLGGGSLPLSVLDSRVDRWIARQRT